MGLLSQEEKAGIKSNSNFINFMRISYSSCKAQELKENVGKFFVQSGKADDAEFRFFETFTAYPVGYRGVITSNKPGNNTVIDTKRNSLFKSDGAKASPLFDSSAITLFKEACEEEGLETKENIEVLFRITSIDGQETDEYLVYLFRESAKEEFKGMDDDANGRMFEFSVLSKPSKNEWFGLQWELSDEAYEEPSDLKDKLKVFYNWK